MRKIVPELTDELLKHFNDVKNIGSEEPYKVGTFRELVEITAKLSFKNKDHLLFYRGQTDDYKNKAGSSSYYPSIYRGNLLFREVANRFDILDGASKVLVELFEEKKVEGYKELKRRKSIQWSILQHYEVCQTPLLDFTHSLRVACSFALLENKNEHGIIAVFGLPYFTNRISINSEHDIINIRLLSICPPTALRPYFQEGYLAGTDDVTTQYDSKSELDFNNRLIAKFSIPRDKSFWQKEFNSIPKQSLYPDNDPIYVLCQSIKDKADRQLKTGDLGEFLKSWAELEEILLNISRKKTQRYLSMREAIRFLYEDNIIDKQLVYEFDRLRNFRNILVHTPNKITSQEIHQYLSLVEIITTQLKKMKPKNYE